MQWRRGFTVAVVLSGLLHLVLAGVLIWASHGHRMPPPPPNAGVIEMMMVQQRGTTPTPRQPTPHAATPSVQPKPDTPPDQKANAAAPAPVQAKQTAPTGMPDTVKQPSVPDLPAAPPDKTGPPASAAAAPAPPAPEATPAPPQPAQASSTPAPRAPVFDLGGTDDDFSAIASGGKIIPASPDNRYRNNPPRYPREAALRGEQGTVVLLIHVSETGMATGADVVKTSGVLSLDDAAVAAVRSWHFHPALQDGKAVPFDVPFRFVFEGE